MEEETELDDAIFLGMLSADEEEYGETAINRDGASQSKEEERQQYLRCADSWLVIRQLPSQGLSFQLWPAATTLVTLFDRHCLDPADSPLAGTFDGRCRRVLELGAGTGFVGIAAAATLGASVTLTDLPHVLPNIRFNAEANSRAVASRGGSVDVAPLRWGEAADAEPAGRKFDVVVGSDVVYHDHLYAPLLETLRFFLCRNSEAGNPVHFVMSHLRRWKKESCFFKKAKKLFDVNVIYRDAPAQGKRVGVVVYRFATKQ